MANKGFFRLNNPQKYKGKDPTNVVYRSGWEFKLMRVLDSHPDIIEWGSEEIVIPYRSPIDGRIHRYFPDFYVKKKNINGIVETCLIEVKPKYQTVAPTAQAKPTRRYLNEVKNWGINSSKWEAAKSYCDNRGWKFLIFTEHELGIAKK